MTLHAFQTCLAGRAHHLSAFFMLGDPTPELSLELALAAIDGGATMLELGLPFSDPCADGPAIQRACLRARAAGVSTGAALEILAAIHAARPAVPLNLLVYGNLVHARGYQAFARDAVACGASTLLVPDIPFEESATLRQATADAGLGHVALVGPLTDAARLRELDRSTTGFLYLAGYQGVTGRDDAGRPPDPDTDLLATVVRQVDRPVCLGFGISTPPQVTAAFAGGARIAVIGSHFARRIDAAIEVAGGPDRDTVLEYFRSALTPLAAAAAQPTTQHHQGEARCS